MNVFELLLSDLFGGNRAAKIEKITAPVLVPLEASAASAFETEVNSLINHNTGYAVQEISSGFDKIGLSGIDRTLAEAVVAGGLEHLTVAVQSSLATGASANGLGEQQ